METLKEKIITILQNEMRNNLYYRDIDVTLKSLVKVEETKDMTMFMLYTNVKDFEIMIHQINDIVAMRFNSAFNEIYKSDMSDDELKSKVLDELKRNLKRYSLRENYIYETNKFFKDNHSNIELTPILPDVITIQEKTMTDIVNILKGLKHRYYECKFRDLISKRTDIVSVTFQDVIVSEIENGYKVELRGFKDYKIVYKVVLRNTGIELKNFRYGTMFEFGKQIDKHSFITQILDNVSEEIDIKNRLSA